jgi:SAM-dependent methyltransferase
VIDYDAELRLHNERLRQAYDVRSTDHVLDIGCGAGQTTREVARMAWEGDALGIDIDPRMIERAREVSDSEGVSNVRFEVGDVQAYPFESGWFDAAISRFGTMFFADVNAAFRNIARAMRPGGRLVMMVWQVCERNEWAVSIDRALADGPNSALSGSSAPNPFSLGEPTTVRRVLAAAAFTGVTLRDVNLPVYYGPDVDSAFEFVGRFASVAGLVRLSDPEAAASALARLRATLETHASERGVWFDSRAWIVTARSS